MDFWTIYSLIGMAVFFTIFGWYTSPEAEKGRLTPSWFVAALTVAAFWPASLVAAALMALWGARDKLDPIPRITDWIILRAQKTPYEHIDSSEGRYMNRWWLFNPEWRYSQKKVFGRQIFKWLPAIRVHHTVKSDAERDFHDHPWNNVSILLRGAYYEVRPLDQSQDPELDSDPTCCEAKLRLPLIPVFRKATDRHRLIVPDDREGVFSLFIMFRWQRKWGFHTKDGWVYYRDYLGLGPKESES